MNILLVHPHDILSSAEPWTRRIKSFAKELVKNNHNVRLVYFPLANGSLTPRPFESYEIIPFKRDTSPLIFLKNTLRLMKLVDWADVVHFQKCHHYSAIPTVFASYLKNKPLHYDWDDWEEMIWYESCGRSLHSKFIGFSFKVLERFLPVLADTTSVASSYLKGLAIKFGVKEENIYSAPVGVDLQEFNPDIDGSRLKIRYNIKNSLVLYIGQLHGAQYIDLFIKAANIVLHQNPHITFMIVGEGVMEKFLKNLTFGLGIEEKLIFAGAVSHDKIPEYIAAADVCVAPFRETKVTRCKSPLKVVEYMGMGKAIVASNVGEVRKMLGGVGVLISPGDQHSMAEGILKLLNDKQLRQDLGKFARYRTENKYNWQNSTASLLAAYEKLLHSE